MARLLSPPMNPNDLINLGNDTICAVSTPQGRGGIAVIRVSGPQALDIVQQRWQGMPLTGMKTHTRSTYKSKKEMIQIFI